MRKIILFASLSLLTCLFWSFSGMTQSYVVDTSWGYNTTYDVTGQDAPSGATTVSLGDDEVSAALPIGFDFPYFGSNYTQFKISSNGFIGIGTSLANPGCCVPDPIPESAPPNNIISFAWEDLNPGFTGGGTISYTTEGSSPDQRLIITFDAVEHYGATTGDVNQQIILNEDGVIEIQTTSMPSGGDAHSMGIENSDGSEGYAHPLRNDTVWSATEDAVLFIPDSVVSVQEPSLSELRTEIRPNPSSGPVNVSFSGTDQKVDLELIGPRGRILKEFRNVGNREQLTIPEANFEGTGIYFLKIASQQGAKVRKIVRTDG